MFCAHIHTHTQYDRDRATQSWKQVNVFVIILTLYVYFARALNGLFIFFFSLNILDVVDNRHRKNSLHLISSHFNSTQDVNNVLARFYATACIRRAHTCIYICVQWALGRARHSVKFECIKFKQGFIVCKNVIFKIEICTNTLMHIAVEFCTRHIMNWNHLEMTLQMALLFEWNFELSSSSWSLLSPSLFPWLKNIANDG